MKIVGIVAEYNPFHNGHLYHLEQVKKEANADIIIAIITGYFTMRGEISVFNKQQKTEIALHYGIDLVIELPMILGTQHADIFCRKAIDILRRLGVTDIYAGSETNDVLHLQQCKELMKTDAYKERIKELIYQGFSQASASRHAASFFGFEISPNDMLNLRYLAECEPDIAFHTIKRTTNYHDIDEESPALASAKAIRRTKLVSSYAPKLTSAIFDEKGFYDNNAIFPLLKYILTVSKTADVKNIFLVEEGIENALCKNEGNNLNELVARYTSRRYTASRITRTLSYILMQVKKEDALAMLKDKKYPIRILGFNKKGRNYLKLIKKDVSFLTNIKENINPIYNLELRIAKLFTLIYKEDFIALEQNLPIKHF